MSASLVKRLQRELKGSPKKGVALGLLCLVAFYFWLPLLTGNKDKIEPAKSSPQKLAAVSPVVAAAIVADADKTKEIFTAPSWRQVRDWAQRDPRRASAKFVGGQRDPFVTPAPAKETVVAQETKSEPELEFTPQVAKLVLTSTLVGGKRRVAVVNGKQYKVGQTIRAHANKTDVQFTVSDISPRLVVLERQGKKYELRLHAVELANTDDELSGDLPLETATE